ncbi:NEL-type E3 ubiquitin ligase domain-containing protein [Rouxiella sp. WC2420]|uniref:RING-type E3 ubiquitin transferase n=1 Tax=Rouxiella sp. WC2420 TaxID=3234145 RepID=A0AB39VY59_9GAMM
MLAPSRQLNNQISPQGSALECFQAECSSKANNCKTMLDYSAVWKEWGKNALGGSGEHRELAIRRLEDCIQRGSIELDLSALGLSELPPILPPKIVKLFANNNKIETLPQTWPPKLNYLKISNNRLTMLTSLPSDLKTLLAKFNQIHTLPAILPLQLRHIDLSNNNINQLPEKLPENLRSLLVSHNLLRSLPEQFPASLTVIKANNNRLVNIQAVYPVMLQMLNCNDNQLSNLPENLGFLPSSCFIFLRKNPLTYQSYQLLRNLEQDPAYQGTTLNYDTVVYPTPGLRTLYDEIGCWLPEVARHGSFRIWESFEKEDNAKAFKQFLRRLGRTESARNNADFKCHVMTWLAELAENPYLRSMTFVIAKEATESCEDRVALSYSQMCRALAMDNVSSGKLDNNLPAVVSLGREMFRLDKLEQIAAEKLQQLRRDNFPHIDEVEIFLAYQVKLKEMLQLSTVTYDMLFFACSHVSHNELLVAVDQVKKEENTEFARWYAQWSAWQEVARRIDPIKFSSADAKKYQMLNSDYDERVSARLTALGLKGDEDGLRMVGKWIMDQITGDIDLSLTQDILGERNILNLLDPVWA